MSPGGCPGCYIVVISVAVRSNEISLCQKVFNFSIIDVGSS